MHHHLPTAAVSGTGNEPWAEVDYLSALHALAEEMDMPLDDCAKRFGTVTVSVSDNGWSFHPALGFAKAR